MYHCRSWLILLGIILSSIFSLALQVEAQKQEILLISESGYVDAIGWYHVVGEVKNGLPYATRSTEIIATFYDFEGTVIATATGFTSIEVLRPGESSPFVIILVDQQQSQKVNNYKLTITWDKAVPKESALSLKLGEGYYDAIGWYHQVGEITNNGRSTATFIEAAVVLYDANGRPIDAATGFTDPYELAPGQTAPFQVISLRKSESQVASVSVNIQSSQYSMIVAQEEPAPKANSEPTKNIEYNEVKYKVSLSPAASLNEKTKSLSISIKNPKTSDAKIYEVHIGLPDDAKVKSASGPSGWTKEINGDSVTFSTESKPLLANKSGKFTVKLDKVVKSLDWDAYDEDGNIINSKTAKVTVRK